MERCECMRMGTPDEHMCGSGNPTGDMDVRAESGTYQQELLESHQEGVDDLFKLKFGR